MAVCCGKINSLMKIWNCAEAKLETQELYEALFGPNDEQTVQK
jgi:hypothetical protein